MHMKYVDLIMVKKKIEIEIDIPFLQSKHRRLNQVGPVMGVPQL